MNSINVAKPVETIVSDIRCNLAIVKEYREDSEPIYIYDLCRTHPDGGMETIQANVYSYVHEAPFVLTAEELKKVKGF